MPRSFICRLRWIAVSAAVLTAALAMPAAATDYTFTTFAGSDGGPAWFDGQGTAARFFFPAGIARDAAGNFYVTDTNRTVRKISPSGEVKTLAGLAEVYGSNDGDGSGARFDGAGGVAVDAAGNIFVVDGEGQTIRKISPSGAVSTLAGAARSQGAVDGVGAAARFYYPWGLAIDSGGNLYVADRLNFTIRKVTPAGAVTTLAGKAGVSGTSDGTGDAARFEYLHGVVVGPDGAIYVGDKSSIRKVTTSGVVTTFAGLPGTEGSADGTGTNARFRYPDGLAFDGAGNLWVADADNHTLRKVTPGGAVTTIAGAAGLSGLTDGTGSAARFRSPRGVAFDLDGNAWVVDGGNFAIRKVTPGAAVTTVAGGFPRLSGAIDATGTAARFDGPRGIAFDPDGNLVVADSNNHTIRRVTPAGAVTTIAGAAGQYGSADGTGPNARFSWMEGIAVDSDGNIYVADFTSHTIRKLTPEGVVTTLAGVAGSSGSADGTGSAARFQNPYGIAVDADGNIYVGDQGNHTIRKITPGGVVTTLAGLAGSSGSANGNGSNARFSYPKGVAVDASGNVYVAESSIRKITPAGDVTTIAAVAGSGIVVGPGGELYTSDYSRHGIRRISPGGAVEVIGGVPERSGSADGTGASARFEFPGFLAFAANGDLYVADDGNNRIRIGRPALAGAMSVDNPAGYVGASHQLSFSGAATSYQWRLVRRPANSTASLSSATDAAPIFTPDVADAFEFELVASDGASTYVGRTLLTPPRIYGSAWTFAEWNGTQYLYVMLSEPLASEVTVDWTTTDGSAVAGLDYVAAGGSLTFAPGETMKQIAVQLLDDATDEESEKFFVTLSNLVGAVQRDAAPSVWITDNDPAPALAISDVSVVEGNPGYTNAVFTVTLSDASGRTVTCSAATQAGSATASSDFMPIASSTLVFLPGETSKSVVVTLIGDYIGEPDETFFVNLTSPANATIADAQGTGTITNDDIIFENPPVLAATATGPTTVALEWNAVVGASAYKIFRKSPGTDYVQIALAEGTSWVDSSVTAGKAYLYRIRGNHLTMDSNNSNAELATTVLFTDPVLVPGVTVVKRAHVTELRTAVNAVRSLAGLGAFTWSDATLTVGATPVRATHVSELRTALSAARTALGLSPVAFTDPSLAQGSTPIKAAHFAELRGGVQ